jgi:hypothetical protein
MIQPLQSLIRLWIEVLVQTRLVGDGDADSAIEKLELGLKPHWIVTSIHCSPRSLIRGLSSFPLLI